LRRNRQARHCVNFWMGVPHEPHWPNSRRLARSRLWDSRWFAMRCSGGNLFRLWKQAGEQYLNR
jgi:hypothetical protein